MKTEIITEDGRMYYRENCKNFARVTCGLISVQHDGALAKLVGNYFEALELKEVPSVLEVPRLTKKARHLETSTYGEIHVRRLPGTIIPNDFRRWTTFVRPTYGQVCIADSAGNVFDIPRLSLKAQTYQGSDADSIAARIRARAEIRDLSFRIVWKDLEYWQKELDELCRIWRERVEAFQAGFTRLGGKVTSL